MFGEVLTAEAVKAEVDPNLAGLNGRSNRNPQPRALLLLLVGDTLLPLLIHLLQSTIEGDMPDFRALLPPNRRRRRAATMNPDGDLGRGPGRPAGGGCYEAAGAFPLPEHGSDGRSESEDEENLSQEGSSPEGWLDPEGGGKKEVAKGFRLEDGAENGRGVVEEGGGGGDDRALSVTHSTLIAWDEAGRYSKQWRPGYAH
jgi:hypothetical protein